MAKLTKSETNESVEVADGSSILEPAEELGVLFGCANAVCGVCKIKVKEGMENLNEKTPEEKEHLYLEEDERLACECQIKQGEVKIDF